MGTNVTQASGPKAQFTYRLNSTDLRCYGTIQLQMRTRIIIPLHPTTAKPHNFLRHCSTGSTFGICLTRRLHATCGTVLHMNSIYSRVVAHCKVPMRDQMVAPSGNTTGCRPYFDKRRIAPAGHLRRRHGFKRICRGALVAVNQYFIHGPARSPGQGRYPVARHRHMTGSQLILPKLSPRNEEGICALPGDRATYTHTFTFWKMAYRLYKLFVLALVKSPGCTHPAGLPPHQSRPG